MASKENLTALKTLVISMGFLLVGGTVLLAGIVWKKVSAESAEVAAGGPKCPGGTIDLKGKGMVIETTVEGQVMRVTTEKKEGITETYLIDMCQGKVITHVALETDAVMVTE